MVLELLIKRYIDCFDLLNLKSTWCINVIFEFLGQFALLRFIYYFLKKGVDDFEIEHTKHVNFWLEVQYPIKVDWLLNI